MANQQAARSLIQELNAPNDLVLEFFLTFARFEYALKRSGFTIGDKTQVSADWDRFARELAQSDGPTLAPVFTCSEYLKNNPPRKQVLNDHNQLAWIHPARTLTDLQNLLLDVRTVRNNAFHGGKFPIPAGPVDEPLRDRKLIEDCLAVLKACLLLPTLPKRIGDFFPPDK